MSRWSRAARSLRPCARRPPLHEANGERITASRAARGPAEAGHARRRRRSPSRPPARAVAAELPALLHDGTGWCRCRTAFPGGTSSAIGGPHEGRRVAPSTRRHVARDVPRAPVGCVVYPACEIAAPGVIRHVEGERFPLGELDGSETPRVQALSAPFGRAGLKAPVLPTSASEIWLKLWGNLTFNPISALTRATLDRICAEPAYPRPRRGDDDRGAGGRRQLGITFRVPLERRIEGAARVGAHKTSMLQDIEAGRPTEIDALVGSVIELAHLTADAGAAHRGGVRLHAAPGRLTRPHIRPSGGNHGRP